MTTTLRFPMDSGSSNSRPADGEPAPSAVRVQLTLLEPHDCVYLPGRTAQMRGLWAGAAPVSDGEAAGIDPRVFESFLNAGFRRSGGVLYQPACRGCQACQPLRIDTSTFKASSSQRRILRKNLDLSVLCGRPECSSEKQELYARYLAGQHQRGPEEAESLEEFLYSSPVTTLEVTYRDAEDKLVAVGLCDVTPNIVSSVYFYWEPLQSRRSLGVLGALWEIEIARREGRRWYHLGYWVRGAKTMHYKASIGAHELLQTDGAWAAAARQGVDLEPRANNRT